MAFEELKNNAENIPEQLQSYIDSQVAYYKLQSFKVAMKSTTTIFKFVLLSLCFGMVLLFCSIALAFGLGEFFGNNAYGFLSVGGLYLVVTLILYLLKDQIIEGPILKKFSEIFFNN
ncbi:competence protein [Flavobacterium crassostreae]|uniref:Competence protein n=2 Tax=Flavobacterium crassostreae TaxID=1763534 RepID=A0A1B9E609_9FLAO|nr:competence protein [Flavobacterium crassostreae]OCB77402.1 competence protein [Flavobacterium crassostreae]